MTTDSDGHADSAPLTGIRVLEVGNYLAAPYCGMQLADLGAEVIKVETPDTGDVVRLAAPFIDGESSSFVRLNRNKRSVALDLKHPRGKAIFLQLVATADVVIENLRPGAMAKLELDYANLAPSNPRLIYVNASGWGRDGPLHLLAGQDIMAQARSGLMSITGEPDRGPIKIGVPICDLVCALYGALGTVAALIARERTGAGQLVDVNLFETAMSLAIWEAGKFFATGEVPGPLGSAHQNSAPYQAVRASDGWFTVGATTVRTWTGFCRALGLEHLEHDPLYTDPNNRFEHRETLIATIEAITITMPVAHWISQLERAGVPCAPIQNYEQSFNDPHLLARHYFWDAPHPTLGTVRQLGSPMHFSQTRIRRDKAGPLLGEDTWDLLSEIGCSATEIEDLQGSGVVAMPQQV